MIRFAAPAALWLLSLLPLIVILYMLRSRREPMPVSSILLWQRTRSDLAAQLPIRRLERSLLLLLQLLAIAAAALALAQPQIQLASGSGDATVVVIDVSASMQAVDITPSRFEAARRQARELLRSVRGPVMLIAAGATPAIAASWGERGAALTALNRLRPTDGPAALDQAIELALAQRPAGREARPRVIVYTDGAGRPAPSAPIGVRFVIVGSASRNIAVTRLHTEPVAAGTHVVVHVRNAGERTEQVPLVISRQNRRVLERRLTVSAGTTAVVAATVKGGGLIRAEVPVHDLLAADNVAYALAGRVRPRVLVVGEPERALDEALAAVDARRVAVQRITPETLALADVVILNGTPPVALPPGNYLLIGTTASNLPAAADGTVRAPVVLRWSRGHPVMRYVDLSTIQIAEALRLRVAGGEALAEGEVPLIWAYAGGGIRVVVLGFSLAQTDLALHPAFPILLSNALEWLAGPAPVFEAGEPAALPAGNAREAVLTAPAGGVTRLAARNGLFVLPALDRAGVYTLTSGDRRRQIIVTVPSAESEIAPSPPPAAADAGAPRAVVERAVPIWPLLLGTALALLMLEWLLWLRTLPKAASSRRARPASGHALRTPSG